MSIIPTGPMAISTGNKELSELQEPDKLRQLSQSGAHPGIRQRLWGLQARLDPTVTFEEYSFWAKIEREMEAEEYRRYMAKLKGGGMVGYLKAYFSNSTEFDASSIEGSQEEVTHSDSAKQDHPEKEKNAIVANDSGLTPIAPSKIHDMDAEWRRAARALRTTGWITIFYLITTDILGWSQTPYVFASVGYGLGVGIFVLFGIAAAASGLMIWKVFLALDSSRYPMLSFGDPFFRLFGPKTRHFINVTQAFQMWCSVCVVLMGNSQVLSQLAKAKVCYIAIVIINMVIGMASGWLRSLKHLGWLCNFAVWFNIVSFIIICAAAALNGPDPTVALQTTLLKKFDPVKTFIGTPPAEYQQQSTNLFAAQFNGIDTIVYAYSGALLFVAFLSEMRHPMDFWKGCLLAQTFILVVYVFFGAFVYTYIGQYSITSITQVVSPYGLQLVSNILALVTGFLAIFLYFNIGMKTVYLEVGQELCGLPPISTKKGYYFWLVLGPVYWIIALVLAVSVPNFTSITNLIGGLLSLNFTYSIPAIMYVAWAIQNAAALPGEGFDPYTGVTTRHDEGWPRYMRGLRKSWWYSVPSILFALGGLASSGMGSWSAIQSLKEIFGPGGTIQTSWSCTAVG
ncbi:hypothetical protein AYO21_03448 [Fonsecaea monophora]|uniref:Amino acid transporter transmembrane domain-containing protein n=1 Tax=Fonsecaea monophora TaxID=254056 RepID=A0A177FF88_9EURO|nr:hypothetical protein AYO21_03448 [Fonsecaea monophora]KAH0843158.1 Transmembrane amino acid transporter family protein [Fonsecaea pedrosoi]OAG42280.1 hypothetical protein AYO21_03448 [Fonsecaea monophora]